MIDRSKIIITSRNGMFTISYLGKKMLIDGYIFNGKSKDDIKDWYISECGRR